MKIQFVWLRTLFDFTIGGVPQSPNKFTAMLKHHRIHLEVVWVGNKSVRGIKVTWKDVNQFTNYTGMHFAPAATAATAPAAPAKKVAKRKAATV